tara:strand:- start:216 stop:1121 length:906 start_codon:yes stop_codon:yes gene_type:complete
MKIALCLYGTMRSPNVCLPTLYSNVINVWNTDVIVCINKCYNHPDKSDGDRIDILKRFGTNVVEQNIETQPDLNTVFPKSFYDKILHLAEQKLKEHNNPHWVNFIGPLMGYHGALYIRYNWYRLGVLIKEKYIDKYDYFIITRPDQLYMFPMFDQSFLNEDEIVYYDQHGFSSDGGINTDFVIISRKLVLNWLSRMSIDYFCDEQLQDVLLNELQTIHPWISEACSRLIIRINGWTMKPMCINSFIACDSPNELSSWNKIMFDGEHYFKYYCDRDPCKHNYGLWKDNYRWINTSEKIKLVK